VGKTTFTGCTAQALALCGFRVLAIDNDSQHNLSTMLYKGTASPNIRDVYRYSIGPAAQRFFRAIRETDIAMLHIITSESALQNDAIHDPFLLQKSMKYMKLQRFYDYILIDNSSGLDTLQVASLHAADAVFVPTELKLFAIKGIEDMYHTLRTSYPDDCTITRIVPMFFREIKSHRQHIEKLKTRFPGKVTDTVIPYDRVFEELLQEKKSLFLHRLYSKAAAYYLKLVHELFDIDEVDTWDAMRAKRRERQRNEARERFYRQKQKMSFQKSFGRSVPQGGMTDTHNTITGDTRQV
jgi:chromosome partitioning protein